MEIKEDIYGDFLKDYYKNKKEKYIKVISNYAADEKWPASYFFRKFEEMPYLERLALNNCNGRVLDVGCGVGCHSKYLIDNGFCVDSIDISPGAIEICKLEGITNANLKSLCDVKEKYDTIILLMNGIGVVKNLKGLKDFLNFAKTILTENGKIICDSSDVSYLKLNDLSIENYHGEFKYRFEYKNKISEPFEWLFIDSCMFSEISKNNGYKFEVIDNGNHYDYLAELSIIK